MMIRNPFNKLLPARCLLCQADAVEGYALCHGCFDDLPMILHACPRCGIALPPGSAGRECGSCQIDPPPYHHTVAACSYEAPLEPLLRAFKFHAKLSVGPTLAKLLVEKIKDSSPLPDAVMAVPLHRARLRTRGFNQALELAKPIARQFNLRLDTSTLQRIRATAPQMELEAQERRKNLRNAFALTRPPPYRHVALVDDIMTTGSTAAAIARLLCDHGVERVDVWVVARTHLSL